jgi:uncharacterized protein YpuA (DUF1002 family)
MTTATIEKEDVQQVAEELEVELTDEQIDMVIFMYTNQQKIDPTGSWDIVVERCIDMLLDDFDPLP